MKSRIIRLSFATAVVFTVIISIGIFHKPEPIATAQDILSEAIKAASGLNSIHMKAKMRTRPNDNFISIALDCDLVSIEMWKRINKGTLQWRIEKPERYIIMDGKNTTLFINPNWVYKLEEACPLGYCFDSWMGRLLDIQGILNNELEQAKESSDREIHLIHEEINGRDKIMLEVEVQTNIPEDDYLRDTSISDSDILKIYQFDSDTKLLEDFKIYVLEKAQEILVFEITDIEYNANIEDSIFTLDLPNDVFWLDSRQTLPDNEKYSKMTPKEAAAAFFEAASKGDWDEFLKFWPASDIDQRSKDNVVGLVVIYLGEPFQSKGYIGWFIPYKIKDKNGVIHEGNLALRNDNEAKRYIWDGGF